MTMLAPGISRIPTSQGDRDNCFLVEDDDGFTLVDVGWRSAPRAIEQTVTRAGHQLTDIARIVVTHAHPDHVQGLAELRRRTNAEVLIHAGDAPWLASGRVPPSGRCGVLGRTLDKLPLLHWEPVVADQELADGDRVGSLRVIHTPGHSPGHIVLLHEPTSSLLVGDAVFNRGKLSTGHNFLSSDPATRDRTLSKLPRQITAVGFAHGASLIGDKVAGFVSWLDAC